MINFTHLVAFDVEKINMYYSRSLNNIVSFNVIITSMRWLGT